MFQKAGIMIIFQHIYGVGNAKGYLGNQPVFFFILSIPSPRLWHFPPHWLGHGRIPRQAGYIVGDSVGIQKFLFVKGSVLVFIPQTEPQSGIDHSLLLQGVLIKSLRNGNIGEHIQIRTPICHRTGTALPFFQFPGFQLPHRIPLLKGHM